MKRSWLAVCGLFISAGLVLTVQAQEGKEDPGAAKKDPPAKTQSKTESKSDEAEGEAKLDPAVVRDKVSYGLGLNQGKQYKQLGAEINPQMLAKGIADALAGADQKYTDEEIEAAFAVFQKELQASALKKRKELADKNLAEGQAFLDKNGKREGVTTTKSGVQYEVLKAAGKNGKSPKKTDTVVTHYHGTLVDGTVFDSSVKRKEPATFRVDQVIKGWTEVLQLMKVGDKWKVYIPSDLAYGETPRPNGPIGPNAMLIFEIELLEIEEGEGANN